MGISLSKVGDETPAQPSHLNLTKAVPAGAKLTDVYVGLGWDVNQKDGDPAFDNDACAIIVRKGGKAGSNEDFVFFNHLTTKGVTHKGDNLTGAGEGDDEVIELNLPSLDDDVERVVFPVALFQPAAGQNFGSLQNSFVRVVNQDGDVELARCDIAADPSLSSATAMVYGELYRDGSDWAFRALGKPYANLEAILVEYGVEV